MLLPRFQIISIISIVGYDVYKNNSRKHLTNLHQIHVFVGNCNRWVLNMSDKIDMANQSEH